MYSMSLTGIFVLNMIIIVADINYILQLTAYNPVQDARDTQGYANVRIFGRNALLLVYCSIA